MKCLIGDFHSHRRALALVICALAAAGCTVDVEDEFDDQEPTASAEDPLMGPMSFVSSTVMIRFNNCSHCRGSGTLVKENVVLTNKHVATALPSSTVVQLDPQTFTYSDSVPVTAKKTHSSVDLALLRLACNVKVPIPPISKGPPATGDSTLWVGYGPTSWTGGNWGQRRQTWASVAGVNSSSFWTYQASSAPGDSGGSVYRVASGIRRLRGVITWGSSSSVYARAIRADVHRTWITSNANTWVDTSLPSCEDYLAGDPPEPWPPL